MTQRFGRKSGGEAGVQGDVGDEGAGRLLLDDLVAQSDRPPVVGGTGHGQHEAGDREQHGSRGDQPVTAAGGQIHRRSTASRAVASAADEFLPTRSVRLPPVRPRE